MNLLPAFITSWFNTSRPYRVGVYLGSFNPIHNAHLQLARQARDQFKLDAVEIAPLARPFHKKVDFMDDEDRFIMTSLATKGERGLVACRMDIDATTPGLAEYKARFPEAEARMRLVLQRTLNLLGAVKAKYTALTRRPVQLNYILGIDALAGYPDAWKLPEYAQFVQKCRFLVAPRPGGPSIPQVVQAMRKIHSDFQWEALNVIPSVISSTDIRTLMHHNQPVPISHVPPSVARYLHENRERLLPAKSA